MHASADPVNLGVDFSGAAWRCLVKLTTTSLTPSRVLPHLNPPLPTSSHHDTINSDHKSFNPSQTNLILNYFSFSFQVLGFLRLSHIPRVLLPPYRVEVRIEERPQTTDITTSVATSGTGSCLCRHKHAEQCHDDSWKPDAGFNSYAVYAGD